MENISINGKEGKMLTKQDIERIIENTEEEIETAKKDMLVLIDAISERNVIIREMKTELQKAKTVTGYERRLKEEIYWIVNSDFQATQLFNTNDQTDDMFFETGNYMNKENAERMAKVTKLNFLLDRFTRENGWDDKLWEDDKKNKYCIFFYNNYKTIEINSVRTSREVCQVYFLSVEIAQQAVEKYRDLIMEVM